MPTTATSVELIFDRELTDKIQAIWEGFRTEDIRHQHHPDQALPHITLAIRDLSDDATKSLQALAHKLTQFRVSFGSSGMFLKPRGLNYPDDSVVLFLSPKPTEALLEAHRVATKEFRGWNQGRWGHYGSEEWVPHCTLAEHLEKQDVLKALQICGDKLDWPITGWIRRIRLVNFGPGELEELASVPLAHVAA
jgi:2'-5' RNA ligase